MPLLKTCIMAATLAAHAATLRPGPDGTAQPQIAQPQTAQSQTMQSQTDASDYPALLPSDRDLAARDIVARAHRAAGGDTWVRPASLKMTGTAVMYRDGRPVPYDRYIMLRVYPAAKTDAHRADGRVRIEGWRDGRPALLIAFDGGTTYGPDGPLPAGDANRRWSANFGFGAIRNALDDGWMQTRMPDDLIDGRPAFMVELTDPSGGRTLFGIARDDYAILYVGFDTPRGWHERRYSRFFRKDGVDWVQPGRVRLFYNGVKQNEVLWTDFEVNAALDDSLFTITAPPEKPVF